MEKSPVNICDFSYLTEMMGGKTNLIKEMMDDFAEQISGDLAGIQDALIKGNYLTIKQSAHKMKSTVYVMGISILNPVLKEMETLASEGKEIEKIKVLFNQLNEISNKAIWEVNAEKNTMR